MHGPRLRLGPFTSSVKDRHHVRRSSARQGLNSLRTWPLDDYQSMSRFNPSDHSLAHPIGESPLRPALDERSALSRVRTREPHLFSHPVSSPQFLRRVRSNPQTTVQRGPQLRWRRPTSTSRSMRPSAVAISNSPFRRTMWTPPTSTRETSKFSGLMTPSSIPPRAQRQKGQRNDQLAHSYNQILCLDAGSRLLHHQVSRGTPARGRSA